LPLLRFDGQSGRDATPGTRPAGDLVLHPLDAQLTTAGEDKIAAAAQALAA
jgi:hypothetical protein